MPFDASHWPNAVTIAGLIAEGLPAGIHCHACGRFVTADPEGFKPSTLRLGI